MKTEPVRRGEDFIEIDQKKGEWPFLRVQAGEKIALFIDCNKAGQIIGEGSGLALIVLSRKKATALRDFLDEALDGCP